jgi:hypothetical protein
LGVIDKNLFFTAFSALSTMARTANRSGTWGGKVAAAHAARRVGDAAKNNPNVRRAIPAIPARFMKRLHAWREAWREDVKRLVAHHVAMRKAEARHASLAEHMLKAAEDEIHHKEKQLAETQQQLAETQRQLAELRASTQTPQRKPAKRRAEQQVPSAPSAPSAPVEPLKRTRRGRAANTPNPPVQAPAVPSSPVFLPRSPNYYQPDDGPSTPDYPPPPGSTGPMNYLPPPGSPDFPPPPDSFNSPNLPADPPGTPGGQYYTGERWDDRDR